MVRSSGIAAVIVGLAWTGLAEAQTTAQPGAPPRSRYMVVREEGKSPQRCLLLKTWKQDNGYPAFQVQAVDTGEVLTVAGSGPSGSAADPRTMTSRIYRWGSDNMSPDGAPQPPPTAAGLAAPLPLGAYAPRSQSVSAPKASDFPAPSAAPRPTPPVQTAQKSDSTPAPAIPAPPNTLVRSNPPPMTPPKSNQSDLQPSRSPSYSSAALPPATPKPSVSTSVIASPRPTPPTLTARKMEPASPPVISTQQNSLVRSDQPPASSKNNQAPTPPKITQLAQQPPIRQSSPAAAPQIVTSKPNITAQRPDSLPAPPVAGSGYSMVGCKPPPLTPMSTQVVQQPTECKPCPCTTTTPRLVPTPCGTVAGKSSCNCPCPTPCDTCGKPCDPCNQKTVVCDSSAKRQPIGSRLFKSNSCNTNSNSCNTSSVVISDPGPLPAKPTAATPATPTLVKAPSQPAKPGDWRESWGKVEPWKASAQANTSKPAESIKRVEATPMTMDPPKQPDPLKAPEHYRDMAMSRTLSNSKIPNPDKPSVADRMKAMLHPVKAPSEPMPSAHAPEVHTIVNAPPPNGAMPPAHPSAPPTKGVIQLAADEPNAFWSPPTPPAAENQSENQVAKNNAFDRTPESPPQGVPPIRPGMAPMPPRGPMVTFPRPPLPPGPPPSPSRPDMGVPSAMANAFTLSGTGRPIPADFGGTPQEPNGFDQPMQGGGSPPLAYGSMGGAPQMPRPPMPNAMAMAMAQQGPNALMSVPPPQSGANAGFAHASSQPVAVPELLATLKDSLCPSDRESAAEQLSELNWRVQPLVVESLMKSARDDPAATVRAACVHALAHMKVNTAEAATVVRNLKNDRDPRVRHEVEEALATFSDSSIQQASHK